MSATTLALVSVWACGATTDAFVRQALARDATNRLGLLVKTSDLIKLDRDVRKLGGYTYRHLDIVDSLAINLPGKNLKKLLRSEIVLHVSMDTEVQKSDAFTVQASGASVAWGSFGLTGKGVTIAVIDSGISQNDDFRQGLNSRLVARANFTAEGQPVLDLAGHGTHVAGIIGGNGTLSSAQNCFQSFYGIAPESNLVSLRVLDRNGVGSVSQVVAAVQWVLRNQSKHNIKVLNLSIGHPVGESYRTDPLCLALEKAWKRGIVVVCAAGNEGRLNADPQEGLDNGGYGTAYGTVQSPGNSPYVITVGAMKRMSAARVNDTIATYSGRGPSRIDFVVKPDLVAPGNQVISTLAPDSTLDLNYSATNGLPYSAYMFTSLTGMSREYFVMSGTSMAAPVVTGAAALMLQQNPSLRPSTIKARLMASADKWLNPNGTPDVFTYGAGYLNIPAALASTVRTTGVGTSPTVVKKADYRVDLVPYGSILKQAFMGENSVTARQLFGTRAMWGTGVTLAGTRAMWGTGFWDDLEIREVNQTSSILNEISLRGEER